MFFFGLNGLQDSELFKEFIKVLVELCVFLIEKWRGQEKYELQNVGYYGGRFSSNTVRFIRRN